MANKIKKLFIVGTLVSSLFVALTACDLNNIQPSSSDTDISSSQEQKTVESIIAVNNKDSYEFGEVLDLSVTATFSDGSSTVITDYIVEGYNDHLGGTQTITVSYQGQTYTLDIIVNEPVLVNISAKASKDSYEWGEDLDLTVIATYSDGSTVEITDYQVEGYDKTQSGQQEVTVSYENKTFTFNVVVKDPALVSITAVSNQDEYALGDELNVTVVATYSDGSTVEITDYQTNGYNNQEVGLQTVTFTFENKTCSIDVVVSEKYDHFPANEFNTFIGQESIQTVIPTPVGYNEWTNTVELEQDGSNYFYATTEDKGDVGVDSLADQYALALRNNNWTVEFRNDEYKATINEGDVILSFNTKDELFSFKAASYTEFPDKAFVGTAITGKAALRAGSKIVLGSADNEFIVTNFEDNYLNTRSCLYTDEKPTIDKDIIRFTLGKQNDNWTLTDVKGRKLGSTGPNQLAWDEGSVEWTIIFSGGSTIIMNATRTYGRLCFNPNNNEVTTYQSVVGTDLIYPQVFRIEETDLIYPTSISLSGKDAVGMGRTNKLSIKYLPENANSLSEVSWSSSDDSVATVKSGVVTGVSVGRAVITAKTKSKGSYLETAYEIEVKEIMLDSWTIMVYVCGADLESGSGFATSDISEMLRVNGQPDDVNIILETGGARSWKGYGISASVLSRYHVENKGLVLDTTLPKESMGKQSTLESFLTWGLQEYPAENTGVIFWNHGGALDGVCFDENFGDDSLLNSEVYAALGNVYEANGIDKLEFVGYDACLMQIQDVAEFNSHYFNYMVGSEEAEDAEGWAYDSWIDDMYAGKDTCSILKACCDGFIAACGSSSDQTLSYLDLSKMANYLEKFEALAAAIKNTARSNYSSFRSILSSVKSYGSGWWSSGLDSYGTIDGLDFLNKLGNNSSYNSYSNQINAAKQAYNQLVAYSKIGSGAGQSHGLVVIAAVSISYPASETHFTNWRSIFN